VQVSNDHGKWRPLHTFLAMIAEHVSELTSLAVSSPLLPKCCAATGQNTVSVLLLALSDELLLNESFKIFDDHYHRLSNVWLPCYSFSFLYRASKVLA